MDPSVGFEIASLLFKFLGSPILKEIKDIWKYEEDIKMLADTVDIIGDVLNDVEGIIYHQESVNKGYKRLREAYLDAQDFVYRVHTLKKKQELMATQIEEAKAEIIKPNGKGKLSFAYVDMKMKPTIDKGRRFFSSSNQAKYAVKVHDAIKQIRKKLDAILQDQKFRLVEPSSRSEITLTTARATGSFVDASGTIGRCEDTKKIVSLLLKSSVDDRKIPVIPIVGIGGMGKTTVAQAVFHDESLQTICNFDMKVWVSDFKKHDLKSLLKHILKYNDTNDTSLDSLEEDHLKRRLVDVIQENRFFLVLDDVDNEDPHCWEKLEVLLKKGKEGSKILVTTRYRKVAEVVGRDSIYELYGLLEEDSLQLFERFAFQERTAENLVEIGKQIVEKCRGVPLAVKLMGSYLKSKDRREWEFVRDNNFADIRDKVNQILPILKLSYDDLDPTVKQCFQYCAIFPTNDRIHGTTLKNIWMDNVRFKNRGRTPEDVCDKNLAILLERSLLEETEDVDLFLMHDLIYDLAKEVAGPEILRVDLNPEVDLDKLMAEENVRHLSLNGEDSLTALPKGKRLRSIIRQPEQKITLSWIVSDCPVLRMLNLAHCSIENLPDSMGKLIHLRYLDLSCNKFKTLPNSITELINLRHLSLRNCKHLTRLPSGMGALMSLEHLELDSCVKLEELPRGILKLRKLKRLSIFRCDALDKMPPGMGALMPVCNPPRFIVGHPELSNHTAQLEELRSRFDLADLEIELPWNITSKVPAWDGQAFLLNKESLRKLKIEWKFSPEEFSMNSMDNLNSEEEVSTNSMDILAKLGPPPNLKEFSLHLYQGMAFPHDFDLNLSNLLSLSIENCSRLEYIEDNAPAKPFCLPKLNKLVLRDLPELKGWYRGVAFGVNDDDKEHIQLMPSFPRLLDVTISMCPDVTVSFFLSSLKTSLLSNSISFCTDYGHLCWSMVEENSVRLSATCYDDNLAELLRAIFYLVRIFQIHSCSMNTIRASQHLPVLRHLSIEHCPGFTGEEQCVGDEIECLKSLQTLTLKGCTSLLTLPKWIPSLTSLQELYIESSYFELPTQAVHFLRSKDVSGSTFLFKWLHIEGKLVSSRHIVQLFIFGSLESINAQLKEVEHFPDECKSLRIVPFNFTWKAPAGDSDAILLNKKSLRNLSILWLRNENLEEEVRVTHINILAKLQPPFSLKSFHLTEYQGMTFPPWAAGHGFAHALPNLVFLRIRNCTRCRYLPSMSGLEHLENLELCGLSSLEYIEENVATTPFCLPKLEKLVLSDLPVCRYLLSMGQLECLKELELRGLSSLEYIEENGSAAQFSLSKLEKLDLHDLPEVKGWCRGNIQTSLLSSFPRLSLIKISSCPNLRVPPLLSFAEVSDLESRVAEGLFPRVDVHTDDLMLRLLLWGGDLCLLISKFNATESALSYMAETFRGMSDRLLHLHVERCSGLKTLPGILQRLSTLRSLTIADCPYFTWEEEDLEEEKQSVADEIQSTSLHTWKGLSSLKSLILKQLPNMVRLPKGVQFLTSLENLIIDDCDNLQIPEWLHNVFPYKKVYGGCKQFHLVKKEMDDCSSSTSI